MNLIDIVLRRGDLRQYAAIMDKPFAQILFVGLVGGMPTVEILDRAIGLADEQARLEAAICILERSREDV